MANSQHPKTSAKVQPLLTEEERTACENISLSEDFGKHAKALLALDQGLTQAQAAEKSGLSAGQVRYWIAKFKKERLNIFPEPTLSQLSVKSEPLVQEKSETENKTDEAKEQKVPKKSSKPKKKDSKKQEKTKAKSQKDKKKSKKNKEKDSPKKNKKDSSKKK